MDNFLKVFQINEKRDRSLNYLLEDCCEREIEQITVKVKQWKRVHRCDDCINPAI